MRKTDIEILRSNKILDQRASSLLSQFTFEGKKPRKLKKKERKEREYKNRIPRSYKLYIKSEFWSRRKNAFYQKYGRKCAACGSSKNIQIHHIEYKNFGFESDEQLVQLCNEHHTIFHSRYPTKKNMSKETLEFLEECFFEENAIHRAK